ncbi:MAG: transposase [Puniceicoccales bacterium]|jgi:transposase|nr:transposase [Puniceicoccales bacterium]
MAKACSLDLRERVMEYLEKGRTQAETAEVFHLDRKTIYRWIKRKEKGMLAASKNNIRKPKKIDLEKLRLYIINNPDKTLGQIGREFGVSGIAILYRISQLGTY